MPKFLTLNFKQKFSDFLKTVFPETKFELVLFLFFLTAYGILGTSIALNYRIIFDDRIPWDAYFSFDNRAIVMTGGGYERHPLANYFFDWLREFAYLFSGGRKDDVFRLVLAWCSNIAISLSLVQLYKYLKNIINLPKKISLLILFFFSFFTTPILLSFTPETYTYTLLFLVLFNYYAALKLRKEEKIPATALALTGIAIGGLTITNIVKVYIPLLFEKQVFRNWKKFGNLVLRVLISVSVFLLLFFYRLDFKVLNLLNKSTQQYEKFSTHKVTPIWDMIVSWFFGGNMLFTSFTLRDYHNKKGFEFKALFMETYSSVLPYLFVAVILSLVIWSYAKNFRNKFVQILMISFLVDILIHTVLKFGLHTSYIYGGHFIFIVPLMIGWLFFSYKDSPKTLSSLYVIISISFFYLAITNVFRMVEFFNFLEKYYR
ncbi:DUF6080 domain-containing protein [Kaistella antarctica]|uniref:Glycosyltransferase RgtA/B/C/D-like domain-containing protein n=1 Tax=Kaistella antarctica TaxID=266748 RepID=A0A448NT21_9FLAO|nr:DUF6080 domain-containing protein [Kaistella antarctica]SEV82029.1 hypothetical protein SAMN05421765_0328 [Kaistella antarctica]VEI00488.1 Uncharacterised protein [Kaistella antarctica]